MWGPLTAIADFMAAGGPVLWAILGATVLLWALILERFWYLRGIYPRRAEALVAQWQQRADTLSWQARRVREKLISEATLDLSRYLGVIRALIVILPLLGLLGTVTGMIRVFDGLAVFGSGNPRVLADGVSAATIPTMAGLVAALSGLWFSARLDHHAARERRRLEDRLQHH